MKILVLRTLAVLQMVFGLFITYFSWQLADLKTGTRPTYPGDGIIVTTPPPSTELEFITLLFCIAVFICGLAQRECHVKLGSIQMVFGLVSVGISAFLYGRADILQYGERSDVYYLAYWPLVIGLAVFVVGVVQFRKAWKGKSEAKLAKNQ